MDSQTKLPTKLETTPDEKLFCNAYLTCFDAGQAFLTIQPKTNGKKTTKKYANEQGSRWMKRPAVRSYLSHLTQQVLDESNAELQKVVDEISRIAFFNPANFANLEGDEPTLDLTKLMEDEEAMRAILLEFGTVVDKDGGEHTVFKMKQQDKLAALFKLLDYHRIAGSGLTDATRAINVNVGFLLPGSRWKQPEQADSAYIEPDDG